jgi:hypothetical protein
MAKTYQGALLVAQAGWALKHQGESRTAAAAELFTSRGLVPAELPLGPAELADLGMDGAAGADSRDD